MGLKARSQAKTRPTNVDPRAYIRSLPDARRREEATTLLAMMARITGEKPVMWGPSIIGFGTYHYRYASGREGDWPRAGFSPRKTAMTVYCMPGFSQLSGHLKRLGPHSTGASCLYIKRLDDVDHGALADIIEHSYNSAGG